MLWWKLTRISRICVTFNINVGLSRMSVYSYIGRKSKNVHWIKHRPSPFVLILLYKVGLMTVPVLFYGSEVMRRKKRDLNSIKIAKIIFLFQIKLRNRHNKIKIWGHQERSADIFDFKNCRLQYTMCWTPGQKARYKEFNSGYINIHPTTHVI
jgi:hypothetical protein